MFWKLLIITLQAWVFLSFVQPAKSMLKSSVNGRVAPPCNAENYEQRKLVKDNDSNVKILVCSKENGVFTWKEYSVEEKKTSDTDDVMDDIMLKREKATNFLQRDRRDLNHECYSECCNWEEVREHYEHDIAAATWYWNKFLRWKNRHGCRKSSGW